MADNRLLPYAAALGGLNGNQLLYGGTQADTSGSNSSSAPVGTSLNITYPAWMTDTTARGIGGSFTPDFKAPPSEDILGVTPTFATYAPQAPVSSAYSVNGSSAGVGADSAQANGFSNGPANNGGNAGAALGPGTQGTLAGFSPSVASGLDSQLGNNGALGTANPGTQGTLGGFSPGVASGLDSQGPSAADSSNGGPVGGGAGGGPGGGTAGPGGDNSGSQDAGSGLNGGNDKGGILTPNRLMPVGMVDMPQGKDDAIASVQEGEAVLNKKAVAHYGPAFIAKLNKLMVPKSAVR